MNVAIDYNTGARGQDEVDLAAGFEYSRTIVSQKFTFSIDLLASEDFNHKDGVGDSVVDTVFGVRWKPNSKSAIYLGAQVPLNEDSGIRADLISHFGFFLSL